MESRPTTVASDDRDDNFRVALALAYACLIVYVTLFPFQFNPHATHHPWRFLTDPWPSPVNKRDVLANVLAYIPLGLLVRWCLRKRTPGAQILLATLAGTVLSFVMESVQMYDPPRTPQLIDILTNFAGTLIGAFLGTLLHYPTGPVARLRAWRERWIQPGRGADIGVLAVAFWVLAQW